MLQPTTALYLLRLHIRIAFRYLQKHHREIAGLLILIAAMETASAGDVERQFPSVVFAIGLGVTAAVQILRRDRHFLKLSVPNYRSVLIAEGLSLTLPFDLILAAYGRWSSIGALFLVAVLTSLLNIRIRRTLKFGLTPIFPATAFEWIAGTRRQSVYLVLLYISVAILNASGIVAFLAIIYLATLITTFYSYCESRLMLAATPSKRFLIHKVLQANGLYLAFASPLMLLAFYRVHIHWYMVPIAIVFGILSVTGAVTMKYAYFEAGEDLRITNGLRSTLLMASFFLLPLMLGYEFALWRKAQRRLATLL